ncbi:MAG TPA: hypothetical protein VM325_05630 [Alphaproteobacteria bacterium]|nr:hypothetical protein [Alphaproteobacteria bacterium]
MRSIARLAAIIRGDRPIATIVCIVFVIDLAFVLLHVGHILSTEKIWVVDALRNPRFDLMEEDNYAALFKIVLAGLLAAFLIRAYVISRQPVYAGAAAVLAALVAIGGLRLHVWIGSLIGARLGLQARFPEMAPHMGEALGVAAAGVLLLWLLLFAAARSAGLHAGVGVVLALLFVIMGFFAGGIDLLHALLFFESVWLVWALQVIEETGELATLTILCAVAAAAARRRHHDAPTA